MRKKNLVFGLLITLSMNALAYVTIDMGSYGGQFLLKCDQLMKSAERLKCPADQRESCKDACKNCYNKPNGVACSYIDAGFVQIQEPHESEPAVMCSFDGAELLPPWLELNPDGTEELLQSTEPILSIDH